jgi:hypothetical protein
MKPEKQLADAAVEWRRAELKFLEADRNFYRIAGSIDISDSKKQAAWDKAVQRELIYHGALARVAMLADILIEQGNRK